MTPLRAGVLISGRGSNLQALIDSCGEDEYPARIACILSNAPRAEGLRLGERAGIPTYAVTPNGFASREAFDAALDEILNRAEVELVCLAGYMRILSGPFVEKWGGRLINIHPSLLPAFKGLDVHRRVIESGTRISGCTVHFVTPQPDCGPIIAQAAVPVLPQDTEDTLAARILAAEHKLYPFALKLVAGGFVFLKDGRAVFREPPAGEGQLFSPAPH